MSRLLLFFALVALMLAPMAMHGAEAAPSPAGHLATVADHCASEQQAPGDGDEGEAADCALACSAMPGAAAGIVRSTMVRPVFAARLAPFFAGTAPGSDPPPPRFV